MVLSGQIDSDLIAVVNEEASESNRTAGLQTRARDLLAFAQIETIQLCAIGEQLSDAGVAKSMAKIKLERVKLAASFGHLVQARVA